MWRMLRLAEHPPLFRDHRSLSYAEHLMGVGCRVSQAVEPPDEDRNAIYIVVSQRDGRVVGQSPAACSLLGRADGEAESSAGKRPCWSLMRRVPGAEQLPCTEACASERLTREMPVESISIRLRGRTFELRCEPVGEQIVTTLRSLPGQSQNPYQPLTPREVEVLQLLADGLDGTEIALTLGICPGTVRTHVEHMRDSLDCRTRAELVAKGYRLRYLD